MKTARPEDSMMFVRRTTNPMSVKNKKAVIATPSSVDDIGEDAAVGYD
jgi:hypothetical protein